jgi:hypothetical protein
MDPLPSSHHTLAHVDLLLLVYVSLWLPLKHVLEMVLGRVLGKGLAFTREIVMCPLGHWHSWLAFSVIALSVGVWASMLIGLTAIELTSQAGTSLRLAFQPLYTFLSVLLLIPCWWASLYITVKRVSNLPCELPLAFCAFHFAHTCAC